MATVNNEILIGYIKNFTYGNAHLQELLAPHPEAGRIYRIIKTSGLKAAVNETGVEEAQDGVMYQIYIGRGSNKAHMDTICLGDTLNGNYYDKWMFDIDVVTKENQLDYDYNADDLVMLKEWLDTDNADLKQLLRLSPIVVDLDKDNTMTAPASLERELENKIPLEEILARVKKHEEANNRKNEQFVNGINYFTKNDPSFVHAIADVVSRAYNMELGYFSERPDIAKPLLLTSKSRDVNATMAVINIQNYLLAEVADPDFVLTAIINLLTELQRLYIQKQNDEYKTKDNTDTSESSDTKGA